MSKEVVFAIFGAIGAVGIPLAVAFMRIGGLIKVSEYHGEEIEKLRPVVHATNNMVTGLQSQLAGLESQIERLQQTLDRITALVPHVR